MALADTAKLVVQLRLDDKMTGPLGRVGASLSRLEAAGAQVGRGLGQIGSGSLRVIERGALAFAGGVGAAVKVAGDFEAQLNTINTIAKLNAGDLKTLGEGIRQTFVETGQPLEDLTSAYYDLLSAGVDVKDAQALLNTSVKLGIGGLGTTAQAVDLLTTAQNAYGLSLGQTTAASDIFAAAVRDGKVTIDEIAANFAVVAPLAANMGIGIDEVGAVLATMTSAGSTAGESLTDMRSAMVALQRTTPALEDTIKALNITDIQAYAASHGLAETWDLLNRKGKELGYNTIELTGRVEGQNFVLATGGENAARYTSELDAMRESAGEVNAQFSERAQGLNYQLGKFKAGVQNAGITIGSALIPKLVPLIDKLNAFLSGHQADIAKFADNFAAGFATFADRLQSVDFTGVIDGLRLLGEVGKKVVDIFLSLPPGVQGALIAGFAVNKLSGGLLAKGAGNILGGATKIGMELLFKGRGTTPLNPLFVSDVTGGLGGKVPGLPAAGLPAIGAGTIAIGLGAAVATGVLIAAGEGAFDTPTQKEAVNKTITAIREHGYSKWGSGVVEGLRTVSENIKRQELPTLTAAGATGRLAQSMSTLPFGIGELVRKKWSATVNVNTENRIIVNARLSMAQALATATVISNIRSESNSGGFI